MVSEADPLPGLLPSSRQEKTSGSPSSADISSSAPNGLKPSTAGPSKMTAVKTVTFKSPYTPWETTLEIDTNHTSFADLKTKLEAEANQGGSDHQLNFLLHKGRRIDGQESWSKTCEDIAQAKMKQTMHVVFSYPQPMASSISPASSFVGSADAQPDPSGHPTPTTTTTGTSPSQPDLMLNPAYLAVSEAMHFSTFVIRQSLTPIIGLEKVEWNDLVPRPKVGYQVALAGVLELLKVNGIQVGPDGDLTEVQNADLDPKGKGKMKEVDITTGTSNPPAEEDLVDRLKEMLSTLVGEDQHARVSVDVNGCPYNLVIPDILLFDSLQARALLRLLEWRTIASKLDNLLSETPMYVSVPVGAIPAASQTVPQAQTNNNVRRIGFTIRINLSSNMFGVVFKCIFAAVKVVFVFYMLSRGLKWDDTASLLLLGFAVGWWFWECGSILARERARRTEQLRQARNLDRARAERIARETGENQEVPTPLPQMANAPAVRRGVFPFGWLHALFGNHGLHRAARRNNAPAVDVSNWDLAHERRVLRLFYDTGNLPNNLTVDDRHIPDNDRSLPLAPPMANWFFRHVALPVWLLIASTTPAFEFRRRAAIRRREEHMRLLVQKLTRDARTQQLMSSQATQSEAGTTQPPDDSRRQPNVLPRGLSDIARRYYQRVLARGEAVDWEEERAAQEEMQGPAVVDNNEQMALF